MTTIKCPECKHKWDYKGKLATVWCSSCGKKISRKGDKKNGKN